jgi:hypothetical protein
MIAQHKARWANPKFHARMVKKIAKANRTPKRRKACRQNLLHHWANPEWRAKTIAAMRIGWATRDINAIGRATRKRWANPEYKDRVTANIKGAMTKERREAISEEMVLRWQDPEYRKRNLETRRRNRENKNK